MKAVDAASNDARQELGSSTSSSSSVTDSEDEPSRQSTSTSSKPFRSQDKSQPKHDGKGLPHPEAGGKKTSPPMVLPLSLHHSALLINLLLFNLRLLYPHALNLVLVHPRLLNLLPTRLQAPHVISSLCPTG